MKDSNLLFLPAVSFTRSANHSRIPIGTRLLEGVSDISASPACCLFPVTLLACCLRGVHGMKDSNLLFIPAVSPPTISLDRFASTTLVPIDRLHLSSKNSALPACIKKASPEMRAAFNFLISSPLSSFGRFCWTHLSRSSSSHAFISSVVGFVWLACLESYVPERSPRRLIGRRDVGVSEVEKRE